MLIWHGNNYAALCSDARIEMATVLTDIRLWWVFHMRENAKGMVTR